jgi:hypothetical protein
MGITSHADETFVQLRQLIHLQGARTTYTSYMNLPGVFVNLAGGTVVNDPRRYFRTFDSDHPAQHQRVTNLL